MATSISLSFHLPPAGKWKALFATRFSFLCILFSIGSLLFTNTAQSQFPTCIKNGETYLPKCVSNDLEVLSASLTGTQCGCTAGQEITATLNLEIVNKTQSDRTSVAFFANVVATNPDGSPGGTQYVSGCIPTPPSEEPGVPGGETKTFGVVQITYICGQTLQLQDLYLAWTDASGGDPRKCPLDFCEIAPKCGTPETNIDIIPLLSATASAPDVVCFGGTTTLTVSASGGKPPYQYSLNGGAYQSGNTFTVGAGTYTVSVKDAADCIVSTNSVTVDAPTAPLSMDACSKSDVACLGASTGTVNAGTVSNAVGTVNYVWKNSSGTIVGTTPSVSNLPADTYTLTVSDDCSTVTCSVTIGGPTAALSMSECSKTDANCTDPNTGSVSAGTVSNAVGTVTYTWRNSADQIVGNAATVNNLPAGTYTLTVSDDCSSVTCTVTIAPATNCNTNEGCTPGYWKNHPGAWTTTGYSPNQTLESVFDVPDAYGIDNVTLIAALAFTGGPGATGAAKTLLRAAVAALLNASSSDVDYPRTTQEVIDAVNAALASGDRSTMLALATALDADNNLGCPLNNAYEINAPTTSRQNAQEVNGTQISVMASPNPYNDKLLFTIRSTTSGKASLEVFNMLGQKVGIPFEGQLRAGEKRNVEYTVPVNYRSSLIYTLRQNGKQVSGKLLSTRE